MVKNRKIQLSTSVESCAKKFESNLPIESWTFVKELLQAHPEYGNRMGRSLSSLTGPGDGYKKSIDHWLEELYQFFETRGVPEIHGRIAIWGLSKIDPALERFLSQHKFIEAIEKEISPHSFISGEVKKSRMLSSNLHALSRSKEDRSLLDQGLTNKGLLGFGLTSTKKGAVPLHGFKLSHPDDYFYTTSIEKERFANRNEKKLEPLAFVYTNENENTIRLRRFRQSSNNDHLFVTNPNSSVLKELLYHEESDNFIFIYISQVDDSLPLYLYSTLQENLFTAVPEDAREKRKDVEENVDLQSDAISKEDLLERTPFVKALADYINRLWPSIRDEAYTIHLGGEWGSGKSNVLDFLETKLAEEKQVRGKKTKEWLVVKYDAWENQHVDPPWWIFMDNAYRGIRTRERGFRKLWILVREQFWRLFAVNKTYWISFVILSTITYFLIKQFDLKTIFTLSKSSSEQSDFIEAVGTLVPMVGTLWVAFKGIALSLIPGSSEAALNFQRNMNDPMTAVKTHFKTVISYTPRNVAIFIDNVDRCRPEFTVRLLEGIQTLFKSTKILYIVAGDGRWIRKCFEIQYVSFKDIIDKPGHKLGNFFIEKIFQMSINVPNLSTPVIQNYWKHLITMKRGLKLNKKDIQEAAKMNDQRVAQARDHLKNEISESQISRILESKKGTEEERFYQEAAIEKMSSTSILEEIGHRLESYYDFLPPNPRSMKRLVNHYALARQSLILQGTYLNVVNTDSLVRWLILSTKFPHFSDEISEDPNMILKKEFTMLKEFTELAGDGLKPEIVRSIVGR